MMMNESNDNQTIEQFDGSSPDVMDTVTRIRPFVPLDEIVAQQQYQPITYAEFRSIADEIEIEEPIQELLGMLTK